MTTISRHYLNRIAPCVRNHVSQQEVETYHSEVERLVHAYLLAHPGFGLPVADQLEEWTIREESERFMALWQAAAVWAQE